jgi:hypothetical protein
MSYKLTGSNNCIDRTIPSPEQNAHSSQAHTEHFPGQTVHTEQNSIDFKEITLSIFFNHREIKSEIITEENWGSSQIGRN